MNWTTTQQARFDQLRASELAGTLTPAEQAELAELLATLEAEEAKTLAPALARLQAEQAALRQRLAEAQKENEELARLFNQQEQLLAEARQWLAQFESRHQVILQTYTRLTGEQLAVSTAV